MDKRSVFFPVLMVCFLFSSCIQTSTSTASIQTSAGLTNYITEVGGSTPPIQIETATSTPKKPDLHFWNAAYLPKKLKDSLSLPDGMKVVSSQDQAEIKLDVLPRDKSSNIQSQWIYNLVAPFPTLTDEISFSELEKYWKTGSHPGFTDQPLLLTQETKTIFEKVWGTAATDAVKTLPEDQLLKTAWGKQPAWAIIPFEALEPRWKVIQVDGQSPISKSFDNKKYPLMVRFGITGEPENLTVVDSEIQKPTFLSTNRDPEHLSVVILTGTTAMVRFMAQRMEVNGVIYPTEEIGDLLSSADITHISNEVPFYDKCPPANPVRREMRFCSDPRYFDLLTKVGTDVVELTGNHILDWGYEPLISTIQLYNENEMKYYGGGENLNDARKPLLLENHGNKIGFIGCSPAGPMNVWATKDTPGSAKCDWIYIKAQIKKMLEDGYLSIFTFQHHEADLVKPHSSQRVDFQAAADMGAVIISGSQAHFPQAMTFKNGKFIHYGLGNTFFDQMDEFHRPAFIDRQIVYEGRHINTELITIILEDYAQPRLMNTEEREKFLKAIFEASAWETIP